MALNLDRDELRGLLGQLDELERSGEEWTLVYLDQLECSETEDWTGPDEVRLHARLDDAKASEFEVSSLPGPVATVVQYVQIATGASPLDAYKVLNNRSMNNGQTASLGKVGAFRDHADVAVYDTDAGWGDDDDRLGAEKIERPLGDAERLKIRFAEDDADYELTGWVAKPSWLLEEALDKLGDGGGGGSSDADGDVVGDATDTATDTASDAADTAGEAGETATDTVEDATGDATEGEDDSDDSDVIKDVLDGIG